jgi:hypothetical protein
VELTLYKYMPLIFLPSRLQNGLSLALDSRFSDKQEGYSPPERVNVLTPEFG